MNKKINYTNEKIKKEATMKSFRRMMKSKVQRVNKIAITKKQLRSTITKKEYPTNIAFRLIEQLIADGVNIKTEIFNDVIEIEIVSFDRKSQIPDHALKLIKTCEEVAFLRAESHVDYYECEVPYRTAPNNSTDDY